MNKPCSITGRKKMISEGELEKILDLAYREDFCHYAFFFITTSLGLRVNEACKLRISDIDQNQTWIKIANSKQFKETEPFSYLPLTAETTEVLDRLLKERPPSRYDWLFPSSSKQEQADRQKDGPAGLL